LGKEKKSEKLEMLFNLHSRLFISDFPLFTWRGPGADLWNGPEKFDNTFSYSDV
jgi:hypothetical protein